MLIWARCVGAVGKKKDNDKLERRRTDQDEMEEEIQKGEVDVARAASPRDDRIGLIGRPQSEGGRETPTAK